MRPDAVIEILCNLHALLSASVFAHNGTIDKFLGDGLMAVFGAPCRARSTRPMLRGARSTSSNRSSDGTSDAV
jgi:class 3 adenylate cyclase